MSERTGVGRVIGVGGVAPGGAHGAGRRGGTAVSGPGVSLAKPPGAEAMRRILVPFLLLAVAGFVQAGEPARFGKALPDTAAVPVAEAVAAFDLHAGKPQRYSGRIAQVCQAEGCWMVLEDDGRSARVMFKDHAFLIPKDSRGQAQVVGVLSRKELTPEQVEHLREDGKGLEVSPVEYRILAEGVEIEAAPAS
jgi:hypothetical protein